MHLLLRLSLVAFVASLVAPPRPALADVPPAAQPSTPTVSEARIGAYQVAAGVGVGLVGYLGSGLLLLDSNDRDLEMKHVALVGAAVTTTAVIGWVSCLVGRSSPRYTGYCNGATAGAFIGMLPLVVGTGVCIVSFGDDTCFHVALATLSVMPSIGAAVGWHALKRPRPPTQADFVTLRAEDPANVRVRRGGLGAAALTLPLLALRF